METDDILCEAPGPGGMTCMLPYGHKPENQHAFSVELPHDIGNLMEGMMKATEAARLRWEKDARRQRIMFRIWVVMFFIYLTISLWRSFA